MKSMIGNRRHKEQQQLGKRSIHGCARCFCCSSRLSVSSCESSTKSSEDSDQLEALSSLAHGMVQARLEQMIGQHKGPGVHRRRRMSSVAGETSSSRCTLLIAMDRRSYDPKGDFKMSILEVITSRRIEEPNELRSLLNCYLSMNSSDQRPVILEAFYEVCSSLFHCRDR
ncbi:probable transcription repressor OFP9 [Zingiber officinale]|uniref:probable transcription repressor OFP9 n=1 Tax=Zingiber officinale TaxID=94328 RepID=UPI001C4BC416|nr:probable transcription repressor OFP9 [Zingiber officinale]